MPDPVQPPDLQKQYDDQKAAVDAAQNKLTNATAELTTAQSTLRDLGARLGVVSQAVAGYDKTLQDSRDSLEKTLGQALDNAKAALKDQSKKIDDIVGGFNDDLAKQKAAVDKAKADADAAAKDADDANKKSQSAQADLEAQKKLPQTISAGLQEVKAIVQQINAAAQSGDNVKVYFLGNEAQAKLDAIDKVPSADDYSTGVKTKEAAVNAAKDDLKNKKTAAAAAQDAYTKLQQKYDGATKSRQADILSALKAVHPKAA